MRPPRSIFFAFPLVLLFSCQMQSPDPATRIAAIERSSNQSALAGIARHDPNPWVRRAAVTRLADQSLLQQIATDDPDENVRYAAAGMILDYRALTQVVAINARRTTDPSTRPTGWTSEWNRMPLLAELRKTLEDSGLDQRRGWMRIDLTTETESATYSNTPPGMWAHSPSPYQGEIVTIKLWHADQMLAYERWRYSFPMQTPAQAMHAQADVDLDDLIWDLQD